MSSKLLLFIANKKGLSVLNTIISNYSDLVGCIITFNETDVKKNFYNIISKICNEHSYPIYEWNEVKNDLVSLIKKYNISEAIAVGWRFIIPLCINNYLNNDLIVFHDSLLPKYRGFSPTPTAIICGDSKIGMSVLFATEKIDEGDIIIQKKLFVDEKMYINEVIDQQCNLYCEAVKELIHMIQNNTLTSHTQNNQEASYSVWRNPEDCEINWKNDANDIYNLIRATSYPYTGAFTYIEGKRIYVHRALVKNDDLNFAIRYPGKIWTIDKEANPLIICGTGMILLTDVRDENDNKIVFNKIRIKLG